MIEYLNSLFFGLEYETPLKLVEKFIVFLVICGLIFFLIYLIFNKVVFGKSNLHRDHQLSLNFLWSLVVFEFLIGGLLFFFLFRIQGIDFKWNDSSLYLGLFHQIVIFFVTVPLLFFNYYNDYLKSIKKHPSK